MKRHEMSVLVENNPISFNRVSGLLARKGYWIESLTIRGTQDPGVSAMSFAVKCEGWTSGQLKNQLEKLVDVLRIMEPEHGISFYSESVLVKAK